MLQYEVAFDGRAPRTALRGTDFAPLSADGADFWRIHLDVGELRELTVFSTAQETPEVQRSGNETVYIYDRLRAENGADFDITFRLTVRAENGALTFLPELENRSAARVNEIQAPFLAFSRLAGEPAEEVLYIPNSLGERIADPRTYIRRRCHTEYISADYRNIWMQAVYPAPMTMAWLGVQSGGRFLGISRRDDRLRICTFCVGTTPRGTEPQLIFTVSHYPMALCGERIATAPVTVALYDNWYACVLDYRAWADGVFTPVTPPGWVTHMTGWQRIILKHQYGEIFFRYADLPRLYLDGAQYGLDTLLVFGWWKGCFDNGYPEYLPDEQLGGADALREAVAEVQRLGGRVLLYSNGRLIDVKSAFYRSEGRDCCQTDIDGNEYREHYPFSNNGSVLRQFGYKSFVSGCHATKAWRDRLLETTRAKLEFAPDSVFYDQIGGGLTRLCFHPAHEHGGRADDEPRFRLRNIRDIRALLLPTQALGTENLADVFASQFDYVHGSCNGCYPGENSYPYLYRAAYPETILTNRFLHDEREDYKRHYNHAFVFGLRFDVSPYRCRKISVAALPGLGAHLRRLLLLREAFGRFFYEGRLIWTRDDVLPAGVRCAEYAHSGERMVAFLNDGKEPVRFPFRGRTVELEGEFVACVELQADE